MFAPKQIDLDPIIIGTTYDPDALIITEDGDLKDLSDCTVVLTIHDDMTTVLELTTVTGLTVASGIVAILISATDTAALTAGYYSWYLTLTESDDTTVYRYSEGKINVRA